jgi:capsular polysaccharide biosynthesis protein
MKSFFDNQSLLIIIWKWKVHLILVGLITIIAAAIFSSPYFITPLYRSQARVYPANIQSYSEESESEQMLEFFNSSDIKRQVIDVFDLAERFKIKKDDPYFRTKILKKYDDRIACKKTEYESIEIKAMDAEPEVACNIVDSLITFYDQKVKSIRKRKYEELTVSYANDLEKKRAEIDSVTAKMEVLRKGYGMLNYRIQTQQLTQGYTDALARGASRAAVEDIKERLDKLTEKGGEFLQYEGEMASLELQRDTISTRLDKALSLVNKQETYTMLVEEPFPADKKTYPTRWLIVLVSLIAAEFLALLVIFSLEGMQPSKT